MLNPETPVATFETMLDEADREYLLGHFPDAGKLYEHVEGSIGLMIQQTQKSVTIWGTAIGALAGLILPWRGRMLTGMLGAWIGYKLSQETVYAMLGDSPYGPVFERACQGAEKCRAACLGSVAL